MAIGSGRGRGIHDVTGEQEALFKHVLTIARIYPDEDLAGDNDTFLDVACTIGPDGQFLLGCHVGLNFVGEAIRVVEDLAAHEFVAPLHQGNVPCGRIERSLCGTFGYASGARP